MTLDRRRVLAAIAGSGLGFAAFPARAKSHSVTMNPASSQFEPASLTIRRNDTVEWENTTGVLHSVTFDPAAAKSPDAVALPDGVAPFDSGRMKRGDKFSRRFDKSGTYKYICKYHEGMGMVGVVIVK